MIEAGKRYLVTASAWFYAPNGQQYRAAWGTCTLHRTEDVFGFRPSRPSTDWWMRVGEGEEHILIAGCQILYVVSCPTRPKDDFAGITYQDKDTGMNYAGSRIYFAEKITLSELHFKPVL